MTKEIVCHTAYRTKKHLVQLVWNRIFQDEDEPLHEVMRFVDSSVTPVMLAQAADAEHAESVWLKENRWLAGKGTRLSSDAEPQMCLALDGYKLSLYEAIALVMGEREYQETKWPGHMHSVTEFLVYIQDYAAEALHLYSRKNAALVDEECKANIRKIAGLAMACMEQNGAPARILPE